MKNCWRILGIEPSENTVEIEQAYSILLKNIDAQSDPEAFQQLNDAYEGALEYSSDLSKKHNEAQNNNNADLAQTNLNDLSRNSSADNETNKRQEIPATEQKELNLPVAAFIERLSDVLADPKRREQKSAWQEILQNPDLNNIEFRQTTRIPVLALFVDHFSEDLVNLDGAYIPQIILREFADKYAWKEIEVKLIDYFSPNEVGRVLSYAYDNHAFESQLSEAEKPVSILKVFFVMCILVGLLAIIFSGFNKSKNASQSNQEKLQATSQIQWDERLLTCNKVFSGELTDDLKTCLEMAKSGNIKALKRLVWAYSRTGEHFSSQAVYDGLDKLRKYDRAAYLLYFVLMKDHSKQAKRALTAETGIQRLANRNYAPANIFLAVMYALNENVLDQTSNILWLIERAYENNERVISPPNLATIYSNGFLGKKDYQKAFNILNAAANKNYPLQTNNVAWYLATLDNNPLSEPDYALSLALKIVEDPNYAERHTYVDTLAASYAANGDFKKAVETQKRAIALIEKLNVNQSVKKQETADFEERLNLYENQQRLITYSLEVERNEFFKSIKQDLINQLLNRYYVTFTAPVPPKVETEED